MNTRIIYLLNIVLIISILLDCMLCKAAVIKPSVTLSKEQNVAIAKCRQKCFLKNFNNFMFKSNIESNENSEKCRQKPNCFMCWDYCQALVVAEPSLAGAMCNDKLFCTDGCRIACKYHRIVGSNFIKDSVVNNA